MKVSFVKSPVGWVEISSKQKVVSSKEKKSAGDVLVGVEFVGSRGRMSDNSNHWTKASRQLEEYFAGKRKRFELEIEFGEGTDFQKRVWREIAKIPFGETITYKELAKRAGRPRAIRAAAGACGKNPIPIVVPCHRVVGSPSTHSASSGQAGSGSSINLGGYSGGLDKKKWMLEYEGVKLVMN